MRDVKITGSEFVDPGILAISIGINKGDSIVIPSQFVSSAIERLWNHGRYEDVEFAAEIQSGDEVIIEIALKERPRVMNWAITGIKEGKAKEMMDNLKLRRNSELSEYVIEKNKQLIWRDLAAKGFRNAQITENIVPDSINKEMVNVTFEVDRKDRVKIGEIKFTGNEEIEDKKLKSSLKKISEVSWNPLTLFKSKKFTEAEFEEAKDNLIDYYNSKGYRNAIIVADSIYDINEKRLGVEISVEEGNKYYIRNVEWVGNSKYETEQLQRMFGVEKGDTYDKKTMYKRLGLGRDANPDEMSILTIYQNEGYLMSQIDPAEVVVGRDSIDLELKIFEGRPFTINNVEISGNLRVDDEVIRRELATRPGELYNRSLLMQTIRTLGTIGHFNPESIMPDIQPVSNSLVDIAWPLEEQASDQFNVAGGWGSGTFVGSIGITLNNISIKNLFKKGAWKPYPMGQNQRLSIQAQTNGTYYKAFSASFSDPWLGGKKPNSFTVTTHYSDQNNAYYAWNSSTQHFRTFGVSAGLGKRLTWPDPYFTLYAEAKYERYMLKDWSSFIMDNGNANLLSTRVVFSRNSIDQPTYPRRGSEFTASVQLTPPYSLITGKDYSDATMSDQERYRFVEFHKWNLKTQWYQSFLSNSNLVLKLGAEMGYLGHYNPYKISPFERFEVGGDGMSGYSIYGIDIISMRGYDDGALDPVGSDYSLAYNKYTMELRYPVILEPSSQIYVLAFAEAGNGFSSWRDFSPFDLKRSAGVGVRLYLPVVGMLGLDWGYGFDAPAGSSVKSGSQLHFVLGQQF
ncbi:MAG: POTRA domain-containing protein [Rikenellaceae bacterium]